MCADDDQAGVLVIVGFDAELDEAILAVDA